MLMHVDLQFSQHCSVDTVLTLSGLGILVKNHSTVYVRMCSIPVCLSLCQYHTFKCCGFVIVNFEIRKCETSNFVFSFSYHLPHFFGIHDISAVAIIIIIS